MSPRLFIGGKMKLLALLLLVLLPQLASAQTYNCSYFNQLAAGVSTVSTRVIAQNKSRRCLEIYNPAGSTTVYVKFGSEHTGFEGLRVEPNSVWQPKVIPVNSIYTKMKAGATTITILEGS